MDVAASTAAAIGLNKYLREIDELRAKLRVTSDKLTTVLGTGAMTADTILDEQKLQLPWPSWRAARTPTCCAPSSRSVRLPCARS